MMKNLLVFALMATLIFSCTNEPSVPDAQEVPERKPLTGLDAEPGFQAIDSVQVIYFDDPYGDSLRYQRFFSYVAATDTMLVNAVKNQLRESYTIKPAVDTCRSAGKIYLFRQENPVKTMYFSSNCPSCCYVYFIKDGMFYYIPMIDQFRNVINTRKTEAVKP